MKKRGMKKRVLAALMTACMVVGSVPGVSLADVSGETAPNLSGTLTPDAKNNNWYYLHTQYDNTRGHMYTGWHEIDGKWYYFNTASDKGTLGAMLANTTTPDGYQVDANGAWIR